MVHRAWRRVHRRAAGDDTGGTAAVLPDWDRLLAAERPQWDEACRRAAMGPAVLMATTVGGLAALSPLESALAVALTLRGARVHTLLCRGDLPACLRAEISNVPDPRVFERYELQTLLCDGCIAIGHHLFAPLGLPQHTVGALVTPEEQQWARRLATEIPVDEIAHYRADDCAVGEHARAGALRYFAVGDLSSEAHGEIVARRYFEGGLLTARAIGRLLRDHRFEAACFNHGIYLPHGVIGEGCRAAGVRVVNWNIAYRKRCFIFSHGDTYHHTLLSETPEAWTSMPWTDSMEAQILAYLKSRWTGARDWISFHEKPDEEFERFAAAAGLASSRPTIGLLTNVMWDAQLHYRANAFPSMLAWAVNTITYFDKRPDLQLLIRVHPAEVRGTTPSRQPFLEELRRIFPRLPPNVFVIPPESAVSTYAAMRACNAVIIYGTKTGVELTSIGIPVIVGGEAWIRNKGLTMDASTPEEYFALLDRLPIADGIDGGQLARARKYAYHFFFRRMIPLSCVEHRPGWPPYRVRVSGLADLAPGADPGLDVVCAGILAGEPFIFPAETLGLHDAPDGSN
jgi:hypothetical protein